MERPRALGVTGTGSRGASGTRREFAGHSETTQPEDRKRILRFIMQEVVLDQKKVRGQVVIRILWQTGATSEHQIQRRVQSYDRDYGELELVRERITQLNAAGDMDRQIAKILNDEGVRSARGKLFSYENIWLLRHRWGIPTAKINGVSRKGAS
ncbi:hypothetical protein [Mesorhizobium sp. M0118]|uniref:hypothetical protein n=1 Tax=Mesorhizobium sp. M0118 TaxID=2956884 RepID=UPI003337CA13